MRDAAYTEALEGSRETFALRTSGRVDAVYTLPECVFPRQRRLLSRAVRDRQSADGMSVGFRGCPWGSGGVRGVWGYPWGLGVSVGFGGVRGVRVCVRVVRGEGGGPWGGGGVSVGLGEGVRGARGGDVRLASGKGPLDDVHSLFMWH